MLICCFICTVNDLASLRFYNNLGHEFHQNLHDIFERNVATTHKSEVPSVINNKLNEAGDNKLPNDFHQMDIKQKEGENLDVSECRVLVAYV